MKHSSCTADLPATATMTSPALPAVWNTSPRLGKKASKYSNKGSKSLKTVLKTVLKTIVLYARVVAGMVLMIGEVGGEVPAPE